uniref:GH18 domain-containing protein n=1 Tax=Biomphalaria glabrata TaxID=6526 RepID=A0A2C9KTJ1_BIOGL
MTFLFTYIMNKSLRQAYIVIEKMFLLSKINVTVLVVAVFSWIQLTYGRCTRVCFFYASAASPIIFSPRMIDSAISSRCSHLIIGYGYVIDARNPRIQVHDKVTEFMPGFQALRKADANFKILLQIQNWDYNDMRPETYDDVISTASGRRILIQNIVKLLQTMGFDGILIRNSNYGRLVSIKREHILFLQELATEFRSQSSTTGRPKLLLFESLLEPYNTPLIEACSDVNGICREVDMVILETHYLYQRNLTPTHHSRLYNDAPNQKYSVNFVTNYALSKGCAKEKLLIAITADALTFQKSHFLKYQFYNFYGLLPYWVLCSRLKKYSPKVQRYSDQAPFVYYEIWRNDWQRVEESFYNFYEDAVSLKAKVNYIKQKGLGGFVLWEFYSDDNSNDCLDGRYPILSILNRECT